MTFLVFSSMVLILIGSCVVNQSEASLIITDPAMAGKNVKTFSFYMAIKDLSAHEKVLNQKNEFSWLSTQCS